MIIASVLKPRTKIIAEVLGTRLNLVVYKSIEEVTSSDIVSSIMNRQIEMSGMHIGKSRVIYVHELNNQGQRAIPSTTWFVLHEYHLTLELFDNIWVNLKDIHPLRYALEYILKNEQIIQI